MRKHYTKGIEHCNYTHGESQKRNSGASVEYNTWSRMKARCSNPNEPCYKNYGGRGIKVCDMWINSYANFLNDMGRKPSPEHSIDRIDVNGNYEPGNCRWATTMQQFRNIRKNVKVIWNGEEMILTDVAVIHGVSPGRLGWYYKTYKDINEAVRILVAGGRSRKPVVVMDLAGSIVGEYPCMAAAAKAIKGKQCQISLCCQGLRGPYHNLMFSFKRPGDGTIKTQQP